jgi:RNA polymerase sigma factor (sigma-70 family)
VITAAVLCHDGAGVLPRGALVLSQAGWEVAWAQREHLLRIARSRVLTREDAEDVVAEAFRRAGGQDDLPLDAIPAWLTRVTVNLCIDRHRRLLTQRALLQRPELRFDDEPSHEELISDRAEAAWLAAAVDKLPLRQAEALRLRADGHSNAAIAARLSVSVTAVEGLLKRSRAVLREVLKAAGVLLAAFWLRSSSSRRSAAVALIGLVVTLMLQPWQAAPIPPEGTPRSPAAWAPRAAEVTDALSSPHSMGAPFPHSSARAVAGPAPRSSFDPLIGTGPAYDGPHCLAPYCLPVVDRVADRSLGSERPEGWSPADVRDYFGEPAWSPQAAARRPTVVIVSYGVFAWTEGDLRVYRRTFHLPACGRVDGCLTLLTGPDSESGVQRVKSLALEVPAQLSPRSAGMTYNGAPAVEQAQLLQGVSAICPECRLVLVRAASQGQGNLVAAFRLAAKVKADLMVTEIESTDLGDVDLSAPAVYGHGLVISSGGVLGFTGESLPSPLSLPNVIGVGGTDVVAGRLQAVVDTETYCNTRVRQPLWQAPMHTGCPGRAGVDVAAPGPHNEGLSTYVSGGLPGGRGWYHPGHNVQAAALVAGLFARHHLDAVVHGPADLYAHPEWFADIVHGDNACTAAHICQTSASSDPAGCLPGAPQLCYSRLGWDGPTGLGEPRRLPWL